MCVRGLGVEFESTDVSLAVVRDLCTTSYLIRTLGQLGQSWGGPYRGYEGYVGRSMMLQFSTAPGI